MKEVDIIVIGGGAAGLMAAAGAAATAKAARAAATTEAEAAQETREAGAAECAGQPTGTDRCSVLVLEKMPRPGRKIMITGKGRCNFTNAKPWNEFSGHIHPKANFLKPAFYNLTAEKMIDFIERQGIECVVERGDRAFPSSHHASEIVDALVKAAEQAGAQIICNKEVRRIETPDLVGSDGDGRTCRSDGSGTKSDVIAGLTGNPCRSDGNGMKSDVIAGLTGNPCKRFRIKCSDGSEYSCSRLIICTGGLSYPKTGSTGDGFEWAKELGHSVRPLFPSLTAIVPKGYKDLSTSLEMTKGALERTKMIKGTKGHIHRNEPLSEIGKLLCGNQLKNVNLSLVIDGNEAASEFGDMDFTDGGIEGPIGFKVSRKCVNAIINGSKVAVILDMKPAVGLEDLTVRINTLWNEVSKDKRNASRQYKEKFRILLSKVLPMSLVQGFIRLNPNTDHKTLAKALKNWRFEIEGYVGYERCVITAGGISADEISPKTLESKLIAGLYFAGEVLDLDADTGGYNLQAAFSTGYLAGQSAAKSL